MPVAHNIEVSDGLIVDFDKSCKNQRFKITLVNKGKRSVRLKHISSYMKDVNVVNFDQNHAIIVSNGGEKEYLFEVEQSAPIDSGKIRFIFNNRTHVTRTVKIVQEPKQKEKPHHSKPASSCRTPNETKSTRPHRMKSNEKSSAQPTEIVAAQKPATLSAKVEKLCKEIQRESLKGSDHSIRVTDDLCVEFGRFEKTQTCHISIENTMNSKVQLQLIDINMASVRLNKIHGHVADVRVIGAKEVSTLHFDVQFMPGTQSSIATLKLYFDKIIVKRSIQIVYYPKSCSDERSLNFNSLYKAPDDLVNLISQDNIPRNEQFQALDRILPTINDDYEGHFRSLLFLEEIGLHKEIKDRYTQKSAVFGDTEYRKENGKDIRRKYPPGQYELTVQDLFEARPSLQLGDKMIASKLSEPNIVYQGKIVDIKDKDDLILVEFKEDFVKKFDHSDYFVEFRLSRSVFIRQHYALDLAINLFGLDVLTPKDTGYREKPLLDIRLSTNCDLVRKKDGKTVTWFNSQLNEHQKRAVYKVLRGDVLLPYLINGPPGTGKTTTLEEIILQIYKNIEHSKIIIATQSNSAANLITQRLIASKQLESDQVLRLISYKYSSRGTTPDDIIDYSSTYDDLNPDTELPFVKRIEKVMDYRVVIGTSSTIALMLESTKLRSYFTHAVIDEAGQCTELDVLIPMALVGKEGQTIMAGDEMQMPPLVINQQARHRGLAISMLTRLKGDYKIIRDKLGFEQKTLVVNLLSDLVQNYRALPSILSYYNKLFYNSELIPILDPTTSKEAKLLRFVCDTLDLNADSGIHFIDVKNGKCGKWKNSWYNKKEAEVIREIAVKLTKEVGINQNDIGIISPYLMQVRAIEQGLEKHSVPGIKIGTVEDFQGLERKIILISTVRTCESNVTVDVKRQLGFVNCKKRINVAISRANAMVVVVGKAQLLELDANWKALIDDCKEHNTYRDHV